MNGTIKYPELSIVMPFYKEPILVIEMLESIIANSYRDWELLAVDDGMDEDELKMVFEKITDERVRFIKRTAGAKGAQKCRNIGLEEARGKYIIFVDSDDFMTQMSLENRVKAIKANPDVDFVVSPSGTYDNGTFKPYNEQRAFGYNVYKNDFSAFLRKTLPFIVWNNIYCTSSIKKVGLTWDEKILSLQDADFNIQALLLGLNYKYATVPPDYGYRFNGSTSSITSKIRSMQHFESHLYFSEKVNFSVIKRFGHKYDFSLYLGLLYIYTLLFANGVDYKKATRLVYVLKKDNVFYWFLLWLKIQFSKLLDYVLPSDIAAKIPLIPYLFWRKLQRRIIIKRLRRSFL